MTGQDDQVPGRLAGMEASLAELHAKVDRVLTFCDLVAATAAPLMGGKGKVWMALVAKARGGG